MPWTNQASMSNIERQRVEAAWPMLVRGATQTAIAGRLGISQSALSRLLRRWGIYAGAGGYVRDKSGRLWRMPVNGQTPRWPEMRQHLPLDEYWDARNADGALPLAHNADITLTRRYRPNHKASAAVHCWVRSRCAPLATLVDGRDADEMLPWLGWQKDVARLYGVSQSTISRHSRAADAEGGHKATRGKYGWIMAHEHGARHTLPCLSTPAPRKTRKPKRWHWRAHVMSLATLAAIAPAERAFQAEIAGQNATESV